MRAGFDEPLLGLRVSSRIYPRRVLSPYLKISLRQSNNKKLNGCVKAPHPPDVPLRILSLNP
eukprot:972966-Pelagomonas_calceolata.AAC.1